MDSAAARGDSSCWETSGLCLMLFELIRALLIRTNSASKEEEFTIQSKC